MKKGFTIVETLVAITILIIGVIGPLSLAAQGISDGLFAQNQLTANLLAQEAMETVVNWRNTYILRGLPPFEAILATGLSLDSTLNIDSTTGEIKHDCPIDEYGCRLVYDGSIYTSNPNGTGLFSRKITADKISDNELKITVKVSWKNKTVEKSFTTVEYLYGP